MDFSASIIIYIVLALSVLLNIYLIAQLIRVRFESSQATSEVIGSKRTIFIFLILSIALNAFLTYLLFT